MNSKENTSADPANDAREPIVERTIAEVEIEYKPRTEFDAKTLERLAPMALPFGEKQMVTVRPIRPSRTREFSDSLDNEARTIELYCERPEGWGDTLTPDSANAVADKGLEINGPYYRRWFVRQAKWREMTKPGEIAKLQETLDAVIASLSNPAAVKPPAAEG